MQIICNNCRKSRIFKIGQWSNHPSRTPIPKQQKYTDSSLFYLEIEIIYRNGETILFRFPSSKYFSSSSNMTLRLIVHETFHRYPIYTFCDYETQFPYPPNWATPLIVYDTIGEHTYTFRTTQGCDSIIHMTMRIHVAIRDTIRDAICRGYSYDSLDFHYTSTENNIIGRRSNPFCNRMEEATPRRYRLVTVQ